VAGPFLQPASTALGPQDDAEPDTPGLQYSIQANIGGVEAGQIVTLTAEWEDGSDTRMVLVDANVADTKLRTLTFDVLTLPGGEVTLTLSLADLAANESTTQTTVTVREPVPPDVVLTAPLDGAQVSTADDAESGQDGFQLTLEASTVGDASTYKVLVSAGCASDFTACASPVLLKSGEVLHPAGPQPPWVVTLPITNVPEFLIVTVEVEDDFNHLASNSAAIEVALTPCSIDVSGLPDNGIIGNAYCATPESDCASATLTFSATLVGTCPSTMTQVSLRLDDLSVDTQPVQNKTAIFTHAFAHGTQPVVLFATNTGLLSTGQPLTIDLVDPVPLFTSAVVGGFTTPASSSSVTWNNTQDLDAGTSGLQANLHAQVQNGEGGQLTAITVNAVPLVLPSFPVAVTGTTFDTDILGVTLPEGTNQTVVLTAADAAGNTASTSFSYSADVTAPAPLALAIDTLNRRRPSVTLTWTAVADDGNTGAAAAAYDVRFSTTPISAETFDTDCPAAALTRTAPLPTPKAPGQAESYTVRGPDARSPTSPCRFVMRADGGSYYFAARAIDAAGNLGPITTTSSAQLGLRFAKAGVARVSASPLCTGAAPTCDDDFDKRISNIGDVNNDGFADFAVGGNGSFGFCIHYGSDVVAADFRIPADAAVSSGLGTNWQCFLDKVSGTLNEQKAGHSAQNAGDVNGDGLQDLAVPAYLSTNDPEVRVFFGTNGGQLSAVPDVVIKKFNDADGTTTLRWGTGGDFNGDGLGDFVLGARVGNAAGTSDDNKAYVVPGSAAWAKVSGASLVIDLSNATTRANNKVQSWSMAMDGAENPTFGANAGFVGNVLSDAGATQYDDIIVTASYTSTKTTETKAIVIKGRPTPAAADFTLSTLSTFDTGDDANTVVLRPDPATNRDFGLNPNIFKHDVTGDGIADIMIQHTVVTNPGLRTWYVFNGASVRAAFGTTTALRLDVPVDGNNAVTIPSVGDGVYRSPNGAGWLWVGDYDFFGNLGNLTDDDTPGVSPIAIGYRNRADTGKVNIRFNHNDAGLALPYGTYPWVDLKFADPFGSASFLERDVTGVGDFNGDGYDDFAVSTVSGYVVFCY
jgi:hypothetical protein